jgi:hypothetical protein
MIMPFISTSIHGQIRIAEALSKYPWLLILESAVQLYYWI